MPDALRESMLNATHFNKGYDMTETLSAALLDMNWHGIREAVSSVEEFEKAALEKRGWICPPYRHVIAAATSRISSAAAMRQVITPTCGRRCWRTMAISGLSGRAV